MKKQNQIAKPDKPSVDYSNQYKHSSAATIASFIPLSNQFNTNLFQKALEQYKYKSSVPVN